MDFSAITCVRREWRHACRSSNADAVLAHLVELEDDIANFGTDNLDDLFRAAQLRPAGGRDEPWRITAALIRQFDLDPIIGIGLLANLCPGLLSVARQLDWGHTEPWRDGELFGTDLVATAWDVLCSVSGTTVPYPERHVLRLVRQRMESVRGAARRRERHEGAFQQQFDCADPNPIPLLQELTMALRLHGTKVAPRDLRLIHAHRVLGFTYPELASANGLSVKAVEKRCERAEAVLCA